uniref:TSA: Wollemia nobilis Ref_Wollemi_Transcript_22063_1140 transcribed RNA sequence n=1 Tax=Wollemia nobilis TaxID=56998 RepID=A0A0C9RHE9_9CONI
MGIANLRCPTFIHTRRNCTLHNHFKVGASDTTCYHFTYNNLNKKSVSHWPPRLLYHSRASKISALDKNNNNNDGCSKCSNWAFVHASAGSSSSSPLGPFVTALALVLQNIKGRLMSGGEQGPYNIKATVKKLATRLQACRKLFREAETGNDGFLQQGGLGMALLSTTSMARQRISPVLETLGANPTFMSGLLSWVIAQVLKVVTTFVVEKRWDLKMLVGCGGMPSSHAALCVGLTTSVALCHGVSDALFPVCLGFSLIVMYDATGVRRHAGMQAEVLNLIVEDLFQGHPLSEKKLKEILGHTPLQVFAGACLGVLVGYLCSRSCSVAL